MTVICEGFSVYLVEVKRSCPPVVGEICNLTCFPLLDVICQADRSLFHASVSGWMTLHFSQSIFLQILFTFSKFFFSSLFSCPVLP